MPDRAQGSDARYEWREAIGLAFVVALQRLSPRQRAVLALRDVLAFRASTVAEMLGATEVSVNRTQHGMRVSACLPITNGGPKGSRRPRRRREPGVTDYY
jgi:RNA polymerase sigma-70 factor (ECF subfamily)